MSAAASAWKNNAINVVKLEIYPPSLLTSANNPVKSAIDPKTNAINQNANINLLK